jgi:hypothetical protein
MGKKYLYTDDLCINTPSHEVWGRVGTDIETGERILLVNRERKPIFHNLGEGNWRQINIGDYGDEYTTNYLSRTTLPTKGLEFANKKVARVIEDSIDMHLAYNRKKGLPTENLEENRKKFGVSSLLGESVSSDNYVQASYSPTSMTLYLRNKSFRGMNKGKRTDFTQQIQYCVGSMKASSISVTPEDYLLIKSGFRNIEIKLEKQNIIGIGELLICSEEVSLQEEEGNLGELAIEAELKEMNPEYILSYPDLGQRLDRLTDGAFLLSRYNGGIEYFIESLLRVISDESRAKKLLKAIIESVESREEPDIKEAKRLLKEYEIAKSAK